MVKEGKSYSEFVSQILHDLRNPITSVIGYLHILENKTYVNKEQKEWMERIKDEVNKLLILVQKLSEENKKRKKLP